MHHERGIIYVRECTRTGRYIHVPVRSNVLMRGICFFFACTEADPHSGLATFHNLSLSGGKCSDVQLRVCVSVGLLGDVALL